MAFNQRALQTFFYALGVVCALFAGSAQSAQLTLALAEVVGFYPAILASELGYFEREGLQVRVIRCINGKRCLKHLLDGEAQLSTTADLPLVFAAHEGKAFDVVATMSTSTKDNVLLVRADSGIESAKDLSGKRVAYVAGTSSHYFVDTYLNFYGVELNSVQRLPMDPAQLEQLIQSHAFDAAGLYEPLGSRARALLGGNAKALHNPRLYTPSFNLISVRSVSDADLVKVLRAISKAIDYINANPQKAQALLDNEPFAKPAKIVSLDQYDFDLKLSQTMLSTMEAQSRWAVRERLVSNSVAPDFLNYIRVGPLYALNPRAVSLLK
ncbi:MAG TPA: ABC transporter substrate-binding protein [Limnobacter sp.]|nr:ABC transporter substrate-binding protein [Limnobacter sp.]